MFITTKYSGYNRHGEQSAAGRFLILMQPNFDTKLTGKQPLRAVVRYVRLRQLGHFMMGSARIGKHRLSLSGSYGGDGLPVSVPDEVYQSGVELPQELYDAWNNGGGWNGAGSEAPAMRAWALATFPRTKAQILRSLRSI
ncbi:MAG TPA: hypothetical protein VFW94_23505 [Candidatus Acidoferrales bacterium]|nr:hypothetical protein [Candidatus Acidoferrales bacterium]